MALAEPDIIIAAFTVLLAGAPIGLTIATMNLTRATREVGKEAERLRIIPSLTFESAAYYLNGNRHQVRYAIKNIGYGHAKNPTAKARLVDGQALEVTPVSKGSYIEKDTGLFNWDIFDGAKVGDKIELEITYSDLKDRDYPPFKHVFEVVV